MIKNWWILTIKGLLSLTFGIIAITFPIGTLLIFTKFFALILALSGSLLIYVSISRRKIDRDHSWKMTEGFIDLAIGLIVLIIPELTAAIFITLITIWISFTGILQILNGYRLRSLYNHWWILILNGFLAITFAVLIFTHPYHALITLMVLIGLQAIVFGSFLIITSINLKKLISDLKTEIPHKEGEEGNQELSYY